MRVVVLLNPRAGRHDVADLPATVLAAFERLDVDAEVRLVAPRTLARAAGEAALTGADAVVAVGGDGTVNAVANGLVGTGVPLGVVPAGTLNHLARDAGLPLAVDEAVRVVAAGNVRHIDAADVNGRVFLNNASLGLYPRIVRLREHARARRGHGRVRATAFAAARVARTFDHLEVALDVDGERTVSTTPFLFVGNNRYRTDLAGLGRRDALDAGELSIAYAEDAGLAATVGLALRGATGRLGSAQGLVSRVAREVVVTSRSSSLTLALDGEVLRLSSPLAFRSRPQALPLLVPAAADAEVAA